MTPACLVTGLTEASHNACGMLTPMAREESNREDLLREATALVERIELMPLDATGATSDDLTPGAPIIAGFRRDGALSIFFGPDLVYQFNAAGELRRAYINGLLYKATERRLASLGSRRTQHEVQLVRHELTDAEQTKVLATMSTRLSELLTLIDSDEFKVNGQQPPETDILGRLRTELKHHAKRQIATRPNV